MDVSVVIPFSVPRDGLSARERELSYVVAREVDPTRDEHDGD